MVNKKSMRNIKRKSNKKSKRNNSRRSKKISRKNVKHQMGGGNEEFCKFIKDNAKLDEITKDAIHVRRQTLFRENQKWFPSIKESYWSNLDNILGEADNNNEIYGNASSLTNTYVNLKDASHINRRHSKPLPVPEQVYGNINNLESLPPLPPRSHSRPVPALRKRPVPLPRSSVSDPVSAPASAPASAPGKKFTDAIKKEAIKTFETQNLGETASVSTNPKYVKFLIDNYGDDYIYSEKITQAMDDYKKQEAANSNDIAANSNNN